MAKMWAGRTAGELNEIADQLNSCILVDSRMAEQDIRGSIAHAQMLAAQGIIPVTSMEKIVDGLAGILEDLRSGALQIDPAAEDIHMFVEEELTARIGTDGKRLHTARSRNDQVALDMRMYVLDTIGEMEALTTELIEALAAKAALYKASVMPGYTHLQRGQPITFGHHLLAYAWMFLRDLDRLQDAGRRTAVSPIGSCALAGTTYPIDRVAEAELLGFEQITPNSIDGVSDRDFCVELVSAIAIQMMHLSRLCEEIVLWSSWEFRFVELSDEFTTGSSIMPQKKNPDMAELIRGKTARVYGDLMSLLTMLKGLPLAYNKDMQECKEPLFDAVDTAVICLKAAAPMLMTMRAREDNMLNAAKAGFINATDLADYLTRKGMPFREAYKITGTIVADCIRNGTVLEDLPLESFKKYSDLFSGDVYEAIDLSNCVESRCSEGGTSTASVEKQLNLLKTEIERMQSNTVK